MANKRRRRWNFYATRAMKAAERLQLRRAEEPEGLEDEIALLRAALKRALTVESLSDPGARKALRDLRLTTKGMEMLVRAVAAQYRISMSSKAKRDLTAGIEAVLNSFGDQILPADD